MQLIETLDRPGCFNKATVQGVELDDTKDALALAKHLGNLAGQVLDPGTPETVRQFTGYIGHKALRIQNYLLERLSAPEQPESAFTLLVSDLESGSEALPELTGQVLRSAVNLETRVLATHA